MTHDEIKNEAESIFRWYGTTPQSFGKYQFADLVRFAKHCVEKANGWRPIDDAPRDESVIHLCLPLNKRFPDDRRVYEGRWCAAQNAFTSVNGFILLSNATHYRPLPPAPEAA